MAEVGEAGPDFFEWTTTEEVGPGAAEEVEHGKEDETEKEAVAVAARAEETQAPVVEEEAANNRLEEVVGETHLADIRKLIDSYAEARLII